MSLSSLDPPTGAAASPLRRIEIFETESQFLVAPAANSVEQFARFPLPMCRRRIVNWIFDLGRVFYQRYRRCMGCVLTLDTVSRQWTPILPQQTVGKEAPMLRVHPSDFGPFAKSVVLAGSFQVVLAAEPRRFDESVPRYPGLHFLHVLEGDGAGSWAFIRTAVHCYQVKREAVVEDDWETVLAAYQSRLKLI